MPSMPVEANDDKSNKIPSETASTGGLFSSVLGPLSQQLVRLLFLLLVLIEEPNPIHFSDLFDHESNRRLCFECKLSVVNSRLNSVIIII